MKVQDIIGKARKMALVLVGGLVSAAAMAQEAGSAEVDIDAARPAVFGLLGIGAAVVAGRTIYRMTRKGAGEASV